MEDAEICNYADDTTIYVVSDKIDDVVGRLEDGVAAILNWCLITIRNVTKKNAM